MVDTPVAKIVDIAATPKPDPVLGYGCPTYFAWAADNVTDEEFLRLYGGRIQAMHERTGGQPAHAFERLANLTGTLGRPNSTDLAKVEAFVRPRVIAFIDSNPPAESKEDVIVAFTNLITGIALDPELRALVG